MNGLSQQQQSSGEAFDGQELPVLVQKSKVAGATVNEVIADTAYSTLENLKTHKAMTIN